MKPRELGLIQGFLLCLRDSETVLLQTSRWKRSLLVFSSGVCLEIAAPRDSRAAVFGRLDRVPNVLVWLAFDLVVCASRSSRLVRE